MHLARVHCTDNVDLEREEGAPFAQHLGTLYSRFPHTRHEEKIFEVHRVLYFWIMEIG